MVKNQSRVHNYMQNLADVIIFFAIGNLKKLQESVNPHNIFLLRIQNNISFCESEPRQ